MTNNDPLTAEERQEAERLCAETDHLWKATHYGSAYCYWCGAPWPRVTDLPTTGCLTFAAKVEKFLTRPTDYERSALVKVLTRAGEHVALLPRALATIAALERERGEAIRILRSACDRDWSDETLVQTANIAANAIYWREQARATAYAEGQRDALGKLFSTVATQTTAGKTAHSALAWVLSEISARYDALATPPPPRPERSRDD